MQVLTVHDALYQDEWNLEEIQRILHLDSSSVSEEERRQSPLIRVLKDRRCSTSLVKLLLDYGADPNYKFCSGSPNTLYFAIYCKDRVEIIRALVEAGAKEDQTGDNSLSVAFAMNAEIEVIRLLLRAGAEMYKQDITGKCPLFYALQHFNVSAFKSLVELQDVDINTSRNMWKDNLLLGVLSINSFRATDFAKFLIDRGIGIDSIDEIGNTPLHLAVRRLKCHSSLVERLLKKGASVNVRNKDGDTPLKLAIQICDPDIVQLLLKYCFLENPQFDLEDGFLGIKLQGMFRGYANDCLREIQRMKSENVGNGQTLFEFLRIFSGKQMRKNEAGTFNVDRLLQILGVDLYPIYSDIISSKFERSLLECKLEGYKMCAVSKDKRSEGICVTREVVMNYDCAKVLANYVNEKDLLNLLIALRN